VVEIHDAHDGVTNVPIEMYLDSGVARVTLNSGASNVGWDGPLADLLIALSQGLAILGEGVEAVERFRGSGKA
jgi:hypothetical protein